MADQRTEEKVFKKHEAPVQAMQASIPYIVSRHIEFVMFDRTKMRDMENELDSYLQANYTSLPEAKKLEQKEIIRKQLTDGRLALESLLQRFLSS
jgi:hypothetical protein